MSANNQLWRFACTEMQRSRHLVLSIQDIRSITAIETFFANLNQPPNPAAFGAAVATVVFPRAGNDQVREAFGDEAADIFARMWHGGEPGESLNLVFNASTVVRDKPQDMAAMVALASVAAELARSNDRSTVQDWISKSRLLAHSTTPITYHEAFDAAIKDYTGASEDRAREASSGIVSLSIDIVGSTEGKSRMRALAAGPDSLIDIYKQFYASFLHRENRLYRSLFDNPDIEWRRMFLVKGIGDEVWIIYELPAESSKAKRAVAALLEAALWTVTETISWSFGDHPDNGPEYDSSAQEKQRWDQMTHPLKIHADVIQNAAEISELRAQTIAKNVCQYAGVDTWPDRVELAGRLSGGFFESTGRAQRIGWRTDYIGHEVDRFFRTSKAALPAVVTVGENLSNLIGMHGELTAYPGLFRATIPNLSEAHLLGIYYVRKCLAASELKGIGYPYCVHYLIPRTALNRLHRDKSFADQALLAPTREVFPADLRNSLLTVEEQEREAEDGSPNNE